MGRIIQYMRWKIRNVPNQDQSIYIYVYIYIYIVLLGWELGI